MVYKSCNRPSRRNRKCARRNNGSGGSPLSRHHPTMWRQWLLLVSCLFCIHSAQAAPPVTPPLVAIIIDDIGDNLSQGLRAVRLPAPAATALLPLTFYARRLAQIAHKHDKEVMLHLPMEASDGSAAGPGAVTLAMAAHEFLRTLASDLARTPPASTITWAAYSRATPTTCAGSCRPCAGAAIYSSSTAAPPSPPSPSVWRRSKACRRCADTSFSTTTPHPPPSPNNSRACWTSPGDKAARSPSVIRMRPRSISSNGVCRNWRRREYKSSPCKPCCNDKLHRRRQDSPPPASTTRRRYPDAISSASRAAHFQIAPRPLCLHRYI